MHDNKPDDLPPPLTPEITSDYPVQWRSNRDMSQPLKKRGNITHAPSSLTQPEGRQGLLKANIAYLSQSLGLSGRLAVKYEVLPPGTRTSAPHAHSASDEVVYCLSGRGLIWQNGHSYPFNAGDFVGWKAGTGISHNVINDTNNGDEGEEEGGGEDLILLVAGEGESRMDDLDLVDKLWYPLNPKRMEDLPEEHRWTDIPKQNEQGTHPALPRIPYSSSTPPLPVPSPSPSFPPISGARPSNIISALSLLSDIDPSDFDFERNQWELYAEGTSLTQEVSQGGGRLRFGVNLERLPPGTRSSDAHAHSLEDELIYIISGNGLVWINGYTYPVSAGDAVGFEAGTGIAHCFINDSNAQENEEGEPLLLWIIGENRTSEGDKVYYPLHPEKRSTFPRWWADCPLFKLGPHDGRPMRPYLGPEWAAEWDEADGEGEIERGIGDLKIDS